MASENLIKFIKQWEGVRTKPYLDAGGVPTIGVGFTTYENGKKVTMKDPPMTMEQIDRLLNKKLDEFSSQVEMIMGNTLKTILPRNAIDAIVALSYNIGTSAFSKSTVLKKLKANKLDFDGIEKAWMMWVKCNGKTLQGLVNRRRAEFSMYKKSVLDQYTKVECYQIGKSGKI